MKFIAQLILLTVLLAACAAPAADIPAASPGLVATQTLTPKNTSAALSATLTPVLDLKPDRSKPETPTITPLPTIPTFTPTFDVRTIVTATLAPKAECPKIASAENASLDFLNLLDCCVLTFTPKHDNLAVLRNLQTQVGERLCNCRS
ncbi:MAG: hypothetical protein L6461_23370 [Anaerolineae bacterium]|nr:hypothetical protein [Anaerolineae bacterium]